MVKDFYFGGKNQNILISNHKRIIKLNVTNSALRTVDYKGGLDFYLKSVKSFKLSSKAKKLKNQIITKV